MASLFSKSPKQLCKEEKFKDEKSFLLDGKHYRVLKKRWLILGVFSLVMLLDLFSTSFFGYINDAASVYYRTTPTETDLLSTLNLLSRGFFAFVLATFSRLLNVKTQALLASGATMIGSICIAVGVVSRTNFSVVVLGQVITGFGSAIATTLSQTVATNWFPDRERGIAVSIPKICRRLSLAISSLVATIILQLNVGSTRGKITSGTPKEKSLIFTFQHSYLIVYSAFAAIALTVFILSQTLIISHPEETPQQKEMKPEEKSENQWSLNQALNEFMLLLKNKSFLFILLAYCLLTSGRPVSGVLLSSVVQAGFPSLSDRFISNMFAVSVGVGSLGPLASGTLLDKLGKPTCTFIIGKIFLFTAFGILSLSLYFKIVPLLYIGNILSAVFRAYLIVCITYALVEAMQHEIKSIRVKAFVVAGSFPWLLNPVYTFAARKLLNSSGPCVAVLFPIPFYAFLLILWVTSSKYVLNKQQENSS